MLGFRVHVVYYRDPVKQYTLKKTTKKGIPINKVTYLDKDEHLSSPWHRNMESEGEWRGWKPLQCLLWFFNLAAVSYYRTDSFTSMFWARMVWLRSGIPHSAIMKTGQGEDLELTYRRNVITPTSVAEWSIGLTPVTNCIYHSPEGCIALMVPIIDFEIFLWKFSRCKEWFQLEDTICLQNQWRKIAPTSSTVLFIGTAWSP